MDKRKSDKTTLLLVLWALLLSLLLYAGAYAAETVSKGKAGLSAEVSGSRLTDLIFAEGSISFLRTEDLDEAKTKALEAAKNEAVLKVAGLFVSHEILMKEKENLTKIFRGNLDEVIREYKIITEDKGEDGFYRITLAARVSEDAVKALLMRNLYNDRLLVITSEKNMARSLKRHVLEHKLISQARGKGYGIVDYRTVRDKRALELVSLIRQGNTEAVKKIALYYLTDIVIAGFVASEFSQQSNDIFSATATGQVKIHQLGAKKELLSLTKYHEKGFGNDKEKAGIAAIEKVSGKMAEEAAKGLSIKVLSRITLTIKEIGDYASVQKTKKLLSEIPYVKEIKEGKSDFSLEETTLYLKTTQGVEYIAGRITELQKFVVKKIHKRDISLEAKRI